MSVNMNYTSTRNTSVSIAASEAIIQGISEEGGLFVPQNLENLTRFSEADFEALAAKSYQERAFDVLKGFLDFEDEELMRCVDKAYRVKGINYGKGLGPNFDTVSVTRTVKADYSSFMLELWHGPTSAFKDMALQILPEFMSVAVQKREQKGRVLVLTATSGDTGKAALEGFQDVEGVDIAVFYPENGVSDVQKLQMTSQDGDNVHVFAVRGNFDDCQNAVKAVFTDYDVTQEAKNSDIIISSANSINWGRLCPQIVYYISAYADLVKQKEINSGDKINICVPTGNFGNILAAYYAMEMGLPVDKLICASNSNNVLTDLLDTGVYDINRDFRTTISPSMDILVSSNLERLLFHLAGSDAVNEWYASLKEHGRFEIDSETKSKLNSLFCGGWCGEDDTAHTIKTVFNETGYLMDPHTAVGYKVCMDYLNRVKTEQNITRFKTKTLIVSTASPYKFSDSVHEILYNQIIEAPDCELERKTGIPIPFPLVGITEREPRFNETLDAYEIKGTVQRIMADVKQAAQNQNQES